MGFGILFFCHKKLGFPHENDISVSFQFSIDGISIKKSHAILLLVFGTRMICFSDIQSRGFSAWMLFLKHPRTHMVSLEEQHKDKR